ncbi:response regulator transcription factor [Myxococcota bacterium]|nr:response regulator transcription factor [Myxococcota bacterium]
MSEDRAARILLVEDEEDILALMEYTLRQEGFATVRASTGRQAIEQARRERPDLVLLDLMLPDLGGAEVCRRLRADGDTAGIPIIMVTARVGEVDRVVGFEAGADDYVTKPFSPRELVLRVRAVLRRSRGDLGDTPALRFEEASLRIDEERHRVWVGGEEVHLTSLEFNLLITLAKRRGRVQRREVLLDDVWGYASGQVTTRTVDTHVKRLREKLSTSADLIETVRGVGYRFKEA